MSPEKFSIISSSHSQYPKDYIRAIDLLIKNSQDDFFSLRIQSKADRMREINKAAAHNQTLPERNIWYTAEEPITKAIIHRILLDRHVIKYLEELNAEPESSIIFLSQYRQDDEFTDRDAGA